MYIFNKYKAFVSNSVDLAEFICFSHMHNAAVVIVKVAPCTLMLQFSVVAYCMYENIKSGGDFP